MTENSGDTQAMTIRVPKQTHKWLRKVAYEERTTMNELVNDAITAYRYLTEELPERETQR